jgi:MFS family permease
MENPLSTLRDKTFLRLYLSQTISLLGDAFTWVGIALLAFQFGGQRSAAILATALTLRVTAFIIFGPYAGVLADRIDRRKIMYLTHCVRMGIVACLPFVTAAWQICFIQCDQSIARCIRSKLSGRCCRLAWCKTNIFCRCSSFYFNASIFINRKETKG